MISISLVHALAGNGDLEEVLNRGEKADIEALHELVSKPLPTEVKRKVLDALVHLADSGSASAITNSLPKMDPQNLQLAFDALALLGDSSVTHELESQTQHESAEVRGYATRALERCREA